MSHSFIFWIVVIIIILIIIFAWKNEPQISYFAPIANTLPPREQVKFAGGAANFTNPEAKIQYQLLVSNFGYPDVVRNKQDGAAIWFNKGILDKIVLADEPTNIANPAQKYFLSTVTNIDIPDDLLCDIIKLDNSIYYDKIKNDLTIRSDHIGTNIAILYAVIELIQNHHH